MIDIDEERAKSLCQNIESSTWPNCESFLQRKSFDSIVYKYAYSLIDDKDFDRTKRLLILGDGIKLSTANFLYFSEKPISEDSIRKLFEVLIDRVKSNIYISLENLQRKFSHHFPYGVADTNENLAEYYKLFLGRTANNNNRDLTNAQLAEFYKKFLYKQSY